MTNEIIAAVNLAGALVILFLMMETTKGSKNDSGQCFWANLRRVVYAAVCVALFAVGIFTLDSPVIIPIPIAVAWCVIIAGLIFFPAMRRMGLIDQDRWVGFHH